MKRKKLPRCTPKEVTRGFRGSDVYGGMIIKAVQDNPGIKLRDLMTLLGEARVVNERWDDRFSWNGYSLSLALEKLVKDKSIVEYVPITSWLYQKITGRVVYARYKIGREVKG